MRVTGKQRERIKQKATSILYRNLYVEPVPLNNMRELYMRAFDCREEIEKVAQSELGKRLFNFSNHASYDYKIQVGHRELEIRVNARKLDPPVANMGGWRDEVPLKLHDDEALPFIEYVIRQAFLQQQVNDAVGFIIDMCAQLNTSGQMHAVMPEISLACDNTLKSEIDSIKRRSQVPPVFDTKELRLQAAATAQLLLKGTFLSSETPDIAISLSSNEIQKITEFYKQEEPEQDEPEVKDSYAGLRDIL